MLGVAITIAQVLAVVMTASLAPRSILVHAP